MIADSLKNIIVNSHIVEHGFSSFKKFFSSPSTPLKQRYLFRKQGGEVYLISTGTDIAKLGKEDLIYSLNSQFNRENSLLTQALSRQSQINWIQFETANLVKVEVKYRGYCLPNTLFDLEHKKLQNEAILIHKMKKIDSWIENSYKTAQ